MTLLLSPHILPFAAALGLAVLVVALHGLAQALGLLPRGDGLPRAAAGLLAQFDLQADAQPDLPALLAAAQALQAAVDAAPRLPARLGSRPALIWLAAILFSFGLGGLFLQVMALSFGNPLSPYVALPIAIFGAVRFSGGFADSVQALLPAPYDTAPQQDLVGLRGVVSQGSSRKNRAVEIHLQDRKGHPHVVTTQAFRNGDMIQKGSAVLTLRKKTGPNGWDLRVIALA